MKRRGSLTFWKVAAASVLAFANLGVAPADEPSQPLPLKQALAKFQLADELKIEAVALEPMVQSPVAVAWDARGRLFVVEMGDYPTGPPQGRVKLLVDTNGDGIADAATTFADALAYPTSVLPYRDGVLVASAPDIWFLADTDGDGKADLRRRVLTGFHEGNQQLRVNGLTWGLDNWIYGANGRSDGNLRLCNVAGEPYGDPLAMRGHDFRFQVETPGRKGKLEITGGFSQFGLAFDDRGERFTSWNTIPIRHVVMEQRLLGRNRRAALFATMQEICAEGSTPRIFPLSATTRRFNSEPTGFFNASCGLTIYRGDALPPAYHGNAFVCEPLSNIVHREVLSPSGPTFFARRAPEEREREFLASNDRWFRPVNLATGPDGALYVVDFYRAWVEHPQFVADAKQRESVDFAEGKQFGRIYRVMARNQASKGWPDLTKCSSRDLVAEFDSPSAWRRQTAQRLIVERGADDVANLLEATVRASTSELARLHALYTLSQSAERLSKVLPAAWADPAPAVRVAALRVIAEQPSRDDRLLFTRLADDNASVRFQLAKSLGDLPRPESTAQVASALATLALQDREDAWFRQAILSSLSGLESLFLREVFSQDLAQARRGPDHLWSLDAQLWLIEIIAASEPSSLEAWTHSNAQLVERNSPNAWPTTLLLGVLEQHRRSKTLGSFDLSAPAVQEHFSSAERDALSADAGGVRRALAIRLLSFAKSDTALTALKSLLAPEQPREVQLAAVWSLGRSEQFDPTQLLTSAVKMATPEIRRAIIETLFTRNASLDWLANGLESGDFVPLDVDPTQQQVLIERAAPPLKERLTKLFKITSASDRREVIDRYLPQVEKRHADLANGAKLFAINCHSCHAIQGKGNRVGPDLATVSGRSRDDLVHDILDPNRAVSTDFLCYLAVTSTGRVLTGLHGGESAGSITLRRPGGLDETIPRDELTEFRTLGQSLMPTGFERTLSADDLADIIGFLKSGKPLP